MKVNELMERLGMTQTVRALAYIKDGLDEMNMISETHIDNAKIDITEDQRYYDLPDDHIRIIDVKCKNHLNNKDEYRAISRLVYEPTVVDGDNK